MRRHLGLLLKTLTVNRDVVFLVGIIAFAVFGMASSANQNNHNLQPELLEVSHKHPDSVVSIIVEKTSADNRVEHLVSRLGGRITQDLQTINAFAAELQARHIPELAQAEGVRWISLESPTLDNTCRWLCLEPLRSEECVQTPRDAEGQSPKDACKGTI